MVPPIDVSEIKTLDDATKAIETWEIPRETAANIAKAFTEYKEKNVLLKSEDYSIDKNHKKGWEKVKIEEYLDRLDLEPTKIMVLRKEIDGPQQEAYVREYIDDGKTPKHLIGKQKFNVLALMNLEEKGYGIIERLPEHKGKWPYQSSLEKNFEKDLWKHDWKELNISYWLKGNQKNLLSFLDINEKHIAYFAERKPEKGHFIRLLQD